MKLNVGCGRNSIEGWINLDCIAIPGVDVVADLNTCATTPLPFPDDHFDEFLLSHVIEHIPNILPLMQELYRVAKPGAKALVRVPYGSSDDAFEDPTHVQQYFHGSFGYFTQPYYWRADYGYRGDWQPEVMQLLVPAATNQGLSPNEILTKVNTLRNQVTELQVELIAIKPMREPIGELQKKAPIEFLLI
jgi:SAM-dependent methyltransferase